MKLFKRKIPADIEGQAVGLLPEDPEDMVSSLPTVLPHHRHSYDPPPSSTDRQTH